MQISLRMISPWSRLRRAACLEVTTPYLRAGDCHCQGFLVLPFGSRGQCVDVAVCGIRLKPTDNRIVVSCLIADLVQDRGCCIITCHGDGSFSQRPICSAYRGGAHVAIALERAHCMTIESQHLRLEREFEMARPCKPPLAQQLPEIPGFRFAADWRSRGRCGDFLMFCALQEWPLGYDMRCLR